jgi:flagellin-like hook-associated protein FlgL
VLDIIQSFSGAGNGVQVAFGNGNGSFKAVTNLVFGGTDHRGLTVGDLNDDGNVDIVTAEMAENAVYTLLGNGDGTFMSAQRINTTGNSRRVLVEDFNNDFIADILATDFTVGGSDMIFQSHARTVLQGAIDVSTQSAARKSLDKLRIDLDRISKGQSSIGAFQSRLEVAAATLSTARNEFTNAAARITDADIAQESAELLRLQILRSSSSALLAQANQQPQLALLLLKG